MKIIKGNEFDKLSLKKQNNFTGIVIWGSGSQYYYQNGKLHRIDGPAYVSCSGYVQYWINGIQTSKEAQELYYNLHKLKGLI